MTLPTDGTGKVSAAQSGTWNVTNVSGTVSLPTGAATSAKQPALVPQARRPPMSSPVQGAASGTPAPVEMTGTDVVVTNAAGAGQFFVTMPAVAAKTNYITGFCVSGTGATARSAQYVALIGILGGTTYFNFSVPAGVDKAIDPIVVQFTRPIAASGTNVAIQLNVPNFGAGNVLAAGLMNGFYK